VVLIVTTLLMAACADLTTQNIHPILSYNVSQVHRLWVAASSGPEGYCRGCANFHPKIANIHSKYVFQMFLVKIRI